MKWPVSVVWMDNLLSVKIWFCYGSCIVLYTLYTKCKEKSHFQRYEHDFVTSQFVTLILFLT